MSPNLRLLRGKVENEISFLYSRPKNQKCSGRLSQPKLALLVHEFALYIITIESFCRCIFFNGAALSPQVGQTVLSCVPQFLLRSYCSSSTIQHFTSTVCTILCMVFVLFLLSNSAVRVQLRDIHRHCHHSSTHRRHHSSSHLHQYTFPDTDQWWYTHSGSPLGHKKQEQERP